MSTQAHMAQHEWMRRRAHQRQDAILNDTEFSRMKRQQVEERKQRHEITIKARQVDVDCKIVRTLRTSANNAEALDAARKVQTRFQDA